MSLSVLVSDFDGTMTANEFYSLAVRRFLPTDPLEPWSAYMAGKITHFEALRDIFARIRAPEKDVLALLADMAPDPFLAQSVARLRANSWAVVIASAGCGWYIDRILDMLGLAGLIEVHANPGTYAPDTGLVMELPPDSSCVCLETGVDKAALVRRFQGTARTVAFAGDGLPDLAAALETPAPLRFAREDLAQALHARGESFWPLVSWTQMTDALLAQGSEPGRRSRL